MKRIREDQQGFNSVYMMLDSGARGSKEQIRQENYDIKDGNDFGGFYTYDEMISELDEMYTQYPSLISQRVDLKDNDYNATPHIHETHEGRFLQMVKISSIYSWFNNWTNFII